MKIVDDDVGRKNNNKFILGISIPSFRISTTHRISISPLSKPFRILDLSVVFDFDVRISADDRLKVDYNYEKFKETFYKEMEEMGNK